MEFQILVIEIRNANISRFGKKENHRLKHTWSGDPKTQMVAFTTIGCWKRTNLPLIMVQVKGFKKPNAFRIEEGIPLNQSLNEFTRVF